MLKYLYISVGYDPIHYYAVRKINTRPTSCGSLVGYSIS